MPRCMCCLALQARHQELSSKMPDATRPLLRQLEALEQLVVGLRACSEQSVAFLRRYTTAVLLLLRQQLPQAAADKACRGSAQRILLQLQLLHQQSSAARGAVEFTHISKSGGSTLCILAKEAQCSSQNFTLHRNCMIAAFEDDPAWSLRRNVTVGDGSVDLNPFCRCPGLPRPWRMSWISTAEMAVESCPGLAPPGGDGSIAAGSKSASHQLPLPCCALQAPTNARHTSRSPG